MPPKKKSVVSATVQAHDDEDCHSDSSEEMSDPEDDIDEDEEAHIFEGFECVRSAAWRRGHEPNMICSWASRLAFFHRKQTF